MFPIENAIYEKVGAIAQITVNRPKALNALNRQTLQEIEAAMRDARADQTIRGVILTGAGDRAFVAGADINEVAAIRGIEATAYAQYGQSVFDLIEAFEKPVIAAVNGYALGGGCELALACTMRLAVPAARMGLPEVKLGIIPGYGGTQRLPRLVGKGRALQMILTGDVIDANEALRIGLVNEVVEPAELLPRARELLGKIQANSPLAVRSAMEVIRRGLDGSQEAGLALERTFFGLCSTSEDKAEGTSAFLEKRPPKFTGR
jgi:enoyl-CoA hydratase/carnithine racemase